MSLVRENVLSAVLGDIVAVARAVARVDGCACCLFAPSGSNTDMTRTGHLGSLLIPVLHY